MSKEKSERGKAFKLFMELKISSTGRRTVYDTFKAIWQGDRCMDDWLVST